MRKLGFTLAETLVVLVVIGVIAAITIPSVVAKYQKLSAETKIKKFYSTINRALRLSQIENEDLSEWIKKDKKNTYHTYTYLETKKFLEQYLLPYMNYIGVEQCNIGSNINVACVKLLDGTGFAWSIDGNGADVVFHLNCCNTTSVNFSKDKFLFQFNKFDKILSGKTNSVYLIEPYTYDWDGTVENLKNHTRYGCYKGTFKNFCAKLIELNGWKIPNDYPW